MKKFKNYCFRCAKDFFESKVNFTLSPFKLHNFISENINSINIIDVRNYDDYIDGHIPFAIHVPYSNLEDNLEMFEKDKINVIYCYSEFCNLAYRAALSVVAHNFPVIVLLGGFKTWQKLGYDIVKNSNN